METIKAKQMFMEDDVLPDELVDCVEEGVAGVRPIVHQHHCPPLHQPNHLPRVHHIVHNGTTVCPCTNQTMFPPVPPFSACYITTPRAPAAISISLLRVVPWPGFIFKA